MTVTDFLQQFAGRGATRNRLAYLFQALPTRLRPMAVIARNDRGHYLAYECKKLNVWREGGLRSQARSYVDNGLMRFVTGKYAKGLPVACIIGHVMDGDLPFAYARIKATVGQNGSALRLQDGPTDEPPLDAMTRFVTTHKRNGHGIELRHALLPFVRAA